MIRSMIILTLLFTAIPIAPLGDVHAAEPPKTNVIFFLIDDLGWKDLGCYGSTLKRFFTDLPEVISAAPPLVCEAYHRMKTPPRFELYDLRTDPYEFRSLAGDPNHAEKLVELQAALAKWRKETDDPLLNPTNLHRLKREIDACFTTDEPSKLRLKLTYPEYFFQSDDTSIDQI